MFFKYQEADLSIIGDPHSGKTFWPLFRNYCFGPLFCFIIFRLIPLLCILIKQHFLSPSTTIQHFLNIVRSKLQENWYVLSSIKSADHQRPGRGVCCVNPPTQRDKYWKPGIGLYMDVKLKIVLNMGRKSGWLFPSVKDSPKTHPEGHRDKSMASGQEDWPTEERPIVLC